MKTAQEWQHEIGYDTDYSPEEKPDEPKVDLDTIKAIQLDAWKQGMTDASQIAFISADPCCENHVQRRINEERDKSKAI